MSSAANCQAFLALQRLLLVVDPNYGEAAWQEAHAFEKLPEAAQAPGHWYRGARPGFIHVDENLNGEFVKELPAGVDASSVVDLPGTGSPTVLETMKTLLPDIEAEQRPRFQARFDALTKTASPAHTGDTVRSFREGAFTATFSSTQGLPDYLAALSETYLEDGMIEGRATGLEASALLLIRRLAEAIAPAGAEATRIMAMLASPGATSLEAAAGYMVRDCVYHNFSAQAEAVLAELLREGDQLIAASQEGLYPVGHAEIMLPLYYTGLFRAAPYLQAAMVGYEVISQNPALDAAGQQVRLRFANAVEEKLVRVMNAMLFAVKDLDGSRARQKRAYVQSLLASGDSDRAYSFVMEAIDLNLFYPKPFKAALLTPDHK